MKTPALAFLLATIIGSTRGILQDSSTGTSFDSTTDTSADAKVNALDNTGVHSSAHPNLRSKSVKRESNKKIHQDTDDEDEDHDEIYPPIKSDDDEEDPYGDDDEKYPDDTDPYGDDDEKYPNGVDDEGPPILHDDTDDDEGHDDEEEPSASKYIQFSQPHDYIDFKSDFNLRHDAVLELHDLAKNNNIIYINGEHYSVDLNEGFAPMDLYVDNGAEYHLDGVDLSEKLYSSSCSVYMRRQGMDAILISREQRHNEESGELEFTGQILTIDIMGEDGGDFHLAAVAPGVLATVKSEDSDPDHKAKLETLEMNSLAVPEDALMDENDDEDNNVIVKKLTPDQLVEMERNRRHQRTKRHLSSGCSQFFVEDIAVVYDSTYCNKQGGHASTKTTLESIASKASMAYQRQGVCTKLKISVYEGHCAANYDPYAPALKTGSIGCDVDGVLQWFRNFWMEKRQTKPRAVAHFFFAKDFPENTIGCAYMNVVCKKRWAYGANDMNYSKNTYINGVLLAHEVGHNNGLSHVSGSHGDPFIMGPSVKQGESTWSSESIATLHNTFPNRGCITTESGGSTCTDIPGWHDQDGSSYNCKWYSLGSNCADYGNGWKHNGHNANSACCACGGGTSNFSTDASSNTSYDRNDTKESEKIIDSEITCGCPQTCTSTILGSVVDDKTIKERISWIVENLNESEEEACELVCGEEFDDICGDACNPSQCKLK